MCSTSMRRIFCEKIQHVQDLPSKDGPEKSRLARVLNLVDLFSIGVGGTIGAGIYVAVGRVARVEAGPSSFLSFFIAGVASLLAGLCYAEFASKIPGTGSAYVYTFVTVGELPAFIIGWSMTLEHAIGSAGIARAGTIYIDTVFNNTLQKIFRHYMPMNVPIFAAYPDFLSFAMIIAFTVMLAIGVKESSRLNAILTFTNIGVVLITSIVCFTKADIHNWQIPKSETSDNGGFLPHGFGGTMAGAGICFYTYVGFDAVATTGDEAKNPRKNVPLAILLTILVVGIAYCTLSMALTLAVPYYELDPVAPIPIMFKNFGWTVGMYLVTLGAVCGLFTSLIGTLFPLPRLLYAMASDNVLFPFLANVHPRFKTPFISTLISGIFTGIVALLFDEQELIAMFSIGTLQSYTIVSISVLVLRYRKKRSGGSYENLDEYKFSPFHILKSPSSSPTNVSEKIIKTCIFCLILTVILLSLCMRFANRVMTTSILGFTFSGFLASIFVVCIFIMWRQPRSDEDANSFEVPLVPLIPCLSIFINVYLTMTMAAVTWIRYCLWMITGFVFYFSYGYYYSYQRWSETNSKENLLLSENTNK